MTISPTNGLSKANGLAGTLTGLSDAGGLSEQPASNGGPFDPNTLTFNGGVRAHWWYIGTATFMNGGSVAGVGDPVSRIDSECTATTTYNHSIGGGASYVRRADHIETGTNGYYLTNLPGGNANIATTGMTIAVRISAVSSISVFNPMSEDFSPRANGAFLATDSGTDLKAYLYGDSTPLASADIKSLIEDGNQHDVEVYVEAGTSPLATTIYVDGTLIASGTVSFGAATSRDILYSGTSNAKIYSRFFATQSFLADRANISNFLTYGPV